MSLLGSVRDMIASASSAEVGGGSHQEPNEEEEEEDPAVGSVADIANGGTNSSTHSVANLEKETKEGDGYETKPRVLFPPQEKAQPPSTSWLFREEEEEEIELQQQHYREQEVPPQQQQQQQQQQRNNQTKEWIDRWTAAGLSEYVSLPMICVLGDTSSGKSSVLSSLIGLELPSASTLTTRCPVLIQLTKPKPTPTAPQHGGGEEQQQPQQQQPQPRATVDVRWHKTRPGPRSRKRSIENGRKTLAKIEQKLEEGRTPSPRADDDDVDDDVDHTNDGVQDGDNTSNHSHGSIATTTTAAAAEDPPPFWRPREVSGELETRLPRVIQEATDVVLAYRDTLVAPDTICVVLESPGCTEELTLVDLPGLVQFQHHHDAGLVGRVERVVLGYARNPRSILLPVVAAPSHIHNSKVLRWALELDPTSRRTIPVLTKPDLVDPGSEPGVLELLQQPAADAMAAMAEHHQQQEQQHPHHRFVHGFYMVKNRGQALLDAGASIADGLADEASYFHTTIPWNALAERNRLGIPGLRRKLAAVLWGLMEDSLPAILREIQQDYEETRSRLEALGPMHETVSDKRRVFHEVSRTLVSRLEADLSGRGGPSRRRATTNTNTSAKESPKDSGAARLHRACRDFCGRIRAGGLATVTELAEGASVLVGVHGSPVDVRAELVFLDQQGGYACCDFVDAKDHTTGVLFDGIGLVAEQGPDFGPGDVWRSEHGDTGEACGGGRVYIGRAGGVFDALRKLPLKRVRTDPSWLDPQIEAYRTDDPICFVNAELFRKVVRDFVEDDWAPPCFEMLRGLEDILSEALENALDEQPVIHRFPLLGNLLRDTTRRVLREILEDARREVGEHLAMEKEHPYTQDDLLSEALEDVRYRHLQRDLELQLRLDQEGVVFDTSALRSVLGACFSKHRARSETSHVAEHLEAVLGCYGRVATPRVLDRTPQVCWRAARTLPGVLRRELGSVTDRTLGVCLGEAPATLALYRDLKQRLGGLRTALEAVVVDRGVEERMQRGPIAPRG